MIETVAVMLGTNALVLIALTFLFRSLINHRLEKAIAEFKIDIERTAQREIETYKAQLEKDRLRLQISYGGIFEKQAIAILELYNNVLSLERAAFEAIYGVGTAADRQQAFRPSWNAIRNSYDESRILFPQDIDDMVGLFIYKMSRGVIEHIRMGERASKKVSDEEFQRIFENQEKASEIINTELPALREKLILSMRKTVGIVSSEF